MRGDLIEAFKITNEIFIDGFHFFYISSQTESLLSRGISKIESANQLDFLLIL